MSSALNKFVSVWRELALESAPYVLPADLAVLDKAGLAASRSGRSKNTYYTVLRSYEAYLDEGLEHPKDNRLHLGLLPQPWCGDLRSATVFILLLNPGLNPGDYFAEYRVPSFKDALVSNLHQASEREFPLLFLDPEFSWHPGARYWSITKLHWLVRALAQQRSMPYRQALGEVARQICILQLVPYHSVAFGLPPPVLDQLESAAMSKAFVQEHLLSRKDNISIIVMRQSRRWDLPDQQNIIKYKGVETRAALLSQQSRGGARLAEHFALHD